MELMLTPTGGSGAAVARKANQRDTRHHNLRLVMDTLYRHGQLSRADISVRTELTKVAVSDLVGELMAEGMLEEIGRGSPTGRGKPATFLRVRSLGRCVVAIDVSAAERIRGGIVDLQGRVLVAEETQVACEFGVDEVLRFARSLIAAAPTRVMGVAVGTPGTVTATGEVLSAPLLGWSGVHLGDELRAALDLPVVVENDANAAVMAEHAAGGPRDLVLVRLSRGVGAGVLVDGSVVRGASSAAGEIGHVVTEPGGPRCACGQNGCLEAVVAARREHGASAAAGEQLGIAIAPIIGLLDVPEVVVSGSGHGLEVDFVDGVTRAVRARTSSRLRRDVTIRPSRVGPDAVMQGVSALLLRERMAAF